MPMKSSQQGMVMSGKPVWTISDIIVESPTVKTFRLTPASKKSLFKFIAGQYVDMSVNIDGEAVNRPYSISSASTQRGTFDLSIKREPDGYVSKYMHDTVKVGDKVGISAPFGQFHFNGKGAKSIVLIGAGVGVTPLISILRSLRAQKWKGDVKAAFGFRRAEDTLYADELKALAADWPNFNLILCYTDEKMDVAQAAKSEMHCMLEAGRMSPARMANHLSDLSAHSYYCCGQMT